MHLIASLDARALAVRVRERDGEQERERKSDAVLPVGVNIYELCVFFSRYFFG